MEVGYRRKKAAQPFKVRVIRDVRDSGRDYWLTKERAQQLFEEGKLIQVQAYNNKWDYGTRETHEYYD